MDNCRLVYNPDQADSDGKLVIPNVVMTRILIHDLILLLSPPEFAKLRALHVFGRCVPSCLRTVRAFTTCCLARRTCLTCLTRLARFTYVPYLRAYRTLFT